MKGVMSKYKRVWQVLYHTGRVGYQLSLKMAAQFLRLEMMSKQKIYDLDMELVYRSGRK